MAVYTPNGLKVGIAPEYGFATLEALVTIEKPNTHIRLLRETEGIGLLGEVGSWAGFAWWVTAGQPGWLMPLVMAGSRATTFLFGQVFAAFLVRVPGYLTLMRWWSVLVGNWPFKVLALIVVSAAVGWKAGLWWLLGAVGGMVLVEGVLTAALTLWFCRLYRLPIGTSERAFHIITARAFRQSGTAPPQWSTGSDAPGWATTMARYLCRYPTHAQMMMADVDPARRFDLLRALRRHSIANYAVGSLDDDIAYQLSQRLRAMIDRAKVREEGRSGDEMLDDFAEDRLAELKGEYRE